MIYLTALLVISASLFSSEEAFLSACKLYKAGDFDKACSLYEGISDKGSAVWHDLGNCYWYKQRYLDAFLAYKKAYKGAHWEDKIFIVQQQDLCLQKLSMKQTKTYAWFMFFEHIISFFSIAFYNSKLVRVPSSWRI